MLWLLPLEDESVGLSDSYMRSVYQMKYVMLEINAFFLRYCASVRLCSQIKQQPTQGNIK